MTIEQQLLRCSRSVEKALDKLLPKAAAKPSSVHRAMRYSLFAGGKRLRPFLCLEAARLCGGSPLAAMNSACALEMIHTYSLIHDDLPAMDDDDFRRGRPTCHKQFGEAMAILAGDALLTWAFQVLAGNGKIKTIGARRAVEILTVVAKAAGSLGMVGGQVADMEMENKPSYIGQRAMLGYVHHHKTGALIRASLVAGAMTAGAKARHIKALDRYGEAIGLAFQIADDILDVVGDKKLLGKSGSDAHNNKTTFVSVYGLETARRKAREEIVKAKKALAVFGRDASVLEALADFIIQRQR